LPGFWGGPRNTRAAALFDVRVEADAGGFARLRWSKVEAWREWARLSEGCYVLRSSVTDCCPAAAALRAPFPGLLRNGHPLFCVDTAVVFLEGDAIIGIRL